MTNSQKLLSLMGLLGAPFVFSLLSATMPNVVAILAGFFGGVIFTSSLGEMLTIGLGALAAGLATGGFDFKSFLIGIL